tara:strand:+ start:277 stop:597 length:321 start_codon:yes stop_codon:yes gene_type:complete
MPYDPERRKRYYEKHKEKNKEKRRLYLQTPEGKKYNRTSRWKTMGVIHDDFNELYEKYINTEICELCNVELTEDKIKTKTTRCLDHDHTTGEFRNIVCHSCNIKRR